MSQPNHKPESQSNPFAGSNKKIFLPSGIPGALPPKKTLVMIVVSAVLIVSGLVWLFSILFPLPPHTITMATGPDGSAYDTYGKSYKRLLAKEGIEVRLVQTLGGVDNLAKLRDSKSGIQVGFVEGGVAQEEDASSLMSLGTVGYEPMWFFSHKLTSDKVLEALRGKRVSVGPEGSDSRALVDELIKRKALEINPVNELNLSPEETQKQLQAGTIDAAILMQSLASPVVRDLINDKGIYLANFSRADAYVARFPSLYKLVMPEGAANLETDRPSRATTLLATKTSMIVRNDLHPAIQYLLMESASQIHARAGVFAKAGEFPAPESLELPLSGDAKQYFKSGKPFLQRYLPFWLAALLEQLLILAIPVLGLLYPLVKGLISFYRWGIQRKMYVIYGQLHWIEREIDKLGDQPPTEEMQTLMKHLENRTNRMKVSSNYMPMLYSLKDTLHYVRNRMDHQGKSA
jgi:TRAP-type uncharacterized transport system substrate-binding protein